MEVKLPQVSAQEKEDFSKNWSCTKMEGVSHGLMSSYHRVFQKGKGDTVEEDQA